MGNNTPSKRDYWHTSQRKTQAYSIYNRKHLNIKDTI